MTRMALSLAFPILLVLGCLAGGESPPTADAPHRLDLDGEPLPVGVIARMGTRRLRHNTPVSCVVWTPDEKTVIAGDADNHIVFWDAATGKEIRRLKGHREWVINLALSADGRTLASVGDDRTIILWDAGSGKELRRITTPYRRLRALAFTPDGKGVAAGGPALKRGAALLCLWDVESGEMLREYGQASEYRGEASEVASIAFSSDDGTVAAGATDGGVRLWAWSGREIRRLKESPGEVQCVAFSPDGKTLASSGGPEASVRLWDMATGKEIRSFQNDHGVQGIAFSPDGKLLAVAEWSGAIRLWNTSSGEKIRDLIGHVGRVNAVPFSASGKRLASAGQDGVVHLWDVASGKDLFPSEGHESAVVSLAFAPDGKTLVSAGDRTVRFWAPDSGKERWHVGPGDDFLYAVVFAPDGKTIATAEGKTVRLLDAGTGKLVRHWDDFAGLVTCAAFSPDGKSVASGGTDGTIRVWDVDADKPPLQLESAPALQPNSTSPTLIETVAFSPDGRTIAAGANWRKVYLWDARTGKRALTLSEERDDLTWQIAFSPSGAILATTDSRGVVLWETASGKQILKFKAYVTPWDAIAFSPAGGLLAIAGSDDLAAPGNNVRLWDAADGRKVDELEEHAGPVVSLAFTPDGRRLASGHREGMTLVWDMTARPADRRREAAHLSEDDLDSLWKDLADDDAGRAYRAVWRFARSPAQAAPYLQRRLAEKAATAEATRIAQWIADLDSDDFDRREQASAALARLGGAALPDIRKAFEREPSPEARRRLAELLRKVDARILSPDRLRVLRALAALEEANAPEAREALQALADKDSPAGLADEAKAALVRLARRAPQSP